MELDLTSDQELLRGTAAKFMEATCPIDVVRQLGGSDTGLPENYIRNAAELGWFSLLVPEEIGGGSVSGHGLRDAVILAEERGRRLQPGPFVPMNIVAAALAAQGSDSQKANVLPAILSGEAIATWAAADATGSWAPGSGVSVSPTDGRFLLSGRVGLIQDAALADWFLVAASGPERLFQFLVPSSTAGVTILPRRTHDITQRFALVDFDAVGLDRNALVGESASTTDDLDRQLQVAVVLSVAETVGAIDVLFDMTRQYAIDRIAFGRPIGSFQAVKHQLADMSLAVEAGKAIATAATRAVQAGESDAAQIASMAKAWVGDTGIDIAQGCFQVFGGIGYTWEHDFHLFLRRITMNSLLFGQPDWHRERICEIHGL
ncbi:MAG TPA: acyl-CoA dehydrogenase family protein [Acidimicrobiales bacterium]|nr:acyl-CoA dehydrogenase family protein [Acidimicrobiales bacterium]